ncbi:MAG: hypothetical protein JWO56_366 [Acidobacteria bacterium]|nr:hypothetical protein [Acidobacteriota bacterium]
MSDTPYNSGGFGVPSGFDTGTGSSGTGSTGSAGTGSEVTSSMAGGAGTCRTCGHTTGNGLEQFLGRIGISDDMVNNLKSSFANVDIEEYLNTAREYLKDGSGKATNYAKDNPGKVAAGVAVLAVGAGLLINSLRDKE